MRRTSLLAPLAVLGAAIGGACTNVSTDITRAVAIQFDPPPFPAVVTNDTLRDTLGKAVSLGAIAFNSSGARVPGAVIRYIALDTGLTIDDKGIVTAQRRNGPVRIIASVNGLQSIQQTLEVARAPDTLFSVDAARDTILFITRPDSATVNVTKLLRVKLATKDTILPPKGITGTRRWLVSYRVLYQGNALLPTDTVIASLWDAGTNVSSIDTTKDDGTAGRRLRVRSLLPPSESLIVVASVKYKGSSVRGSPVQFVVRTR